MPVALFQDWHQDFFGSSRIRCALENYQLSSLQMRRYGFRGPGDVAEIRFVILVQRSGDADNDRVHAFQLRVFGRGCESLAPGPLDLWHRDPENIRTAGVEGRDFSLVNIKTGDRKAALRIQK